MSWRWPAYTAGRVGAVAGRPLCLYLANNLLGAPAAQAIAVAFLATSLGLVVSAADPHRHYYGCRFEARPVNGVPLYVYLASVALAAALGATAAFGVTAWFARDAWVALLAALLYLTEKLADEVQRMRLFERDFARWGNTNLLRAVLQVGAVSAAAWLGGTSMGAAPVVGALALAGAVAFVPQVPRELWRRRPRGTTVLRLLRRATRHLWRQRMLWLLLSLGAGVGYLDRGFSVLLDRAQLPLFMLVVMAFSVVQMSVDFYYVSRHRRDFLDRRIRIGSALRSGAFLGCLAGGVAVGGAAAAVVLATSRNGGEFPLAYVGFIALLQAAIATTAVPQQILYWHHRELAMLRLDAVFWALLAAGAALLALAGARPGWALGLIVGAVALRLAGYLRAARTLDEEQDKTPS